MVFPTLTRPQIAFSAYDFAYWGAASATTQTLIPVVFKHKLPNAAHAPIIWGYVVALSTLVGVVAAPLVGAGADITGQRKAFLAATSVITFMFSLAFVYFEFDVGMAAACAGIALLGNMLVVTLYNSFMVFIADGEDEAAKVSGWATALGNLGPAILLTALGFPSIEMSDLTEFSFLLPVFAISGIWWFVFAIPFFMYVPSGNTATEEAAAMKKKKTLGEDLKDMWESLKATSRNRHLMKFVLAIFIFNDASSAMFQLSLIFGASIGISTQNLFGAVVLNRWLSVIMATAWAVLARYVSARIGFMFVMVIMLGGTMTAFFMTTAYQFWILQVILGAAGTGSFIFCRVLLMSLTPPDRAGQNFGFLAGIGNLAGFFGPVMYSSVGLATGHAKDGFIVLAVFALCGLVVFGTIDFDLGRQAMQSTVIRDKDDEEQPKAQ